MPHLLGSLAYFNQILIPYVSTLQHVGLAFSMIVLVIAFIECFPIIGYILPGTIVFYGAAAFALRQNLIPSYIIFMAIGSFLADMVSFYLGKKGNVAMMKRIEKRKEIVEKVRAFFTKYGAVGTVVGKNIGAIRPMIALIAGTSEISFKKFAIASWIASCIWPFQYLLFVYYLRKHAGVITIIVHRFGLLMVLIAVVYLLVRKLMRGKTGAKLRNPMK